MSSFMMLKQNLHNGHLKWGCIIFLVLSAIIIRLFLFNGGIRGADAFAYAQYAYDIANSRYDLSQINDFYGFRYTLLLPTALSYYIFGINDISSSLFPLLCSLLNIVVIFVITERVLNIKTALLAGILLVFYPLDITFATLLGPDSVIPLLSSLAVLCYLIAEEGDASRQAYLFLLAGLFIGFSITARLTSIFIYGVLFIDQMASRRRVMPVFWISLGLVIPVAAEALYYQSATGDALYRIHQIVHNEALVIGADPVANVSLLFYPKAMFGFNLTGLAYYGFTWWMVAAGLLWAVLKRERRILFLAIWLFVPFLGFEFGTQSLKEMIPIMKNCNYLSLITGPTTIVAAFFLINFGELLLSKFKLNHILMFGMLVVLIAGMNSYGAYRISLNFKNDAAPYIKVADYLKNHRGGVVYTHHFRWPLFLGYFLRYPESLDFRDLNKLNHTEIKRLSGAYIVLHKRYLEADIAGRQYHELPWYARYVDSHPPGWGKPLSFRGRPKYNNTIMYYVR